MKDRRGFLSACLGGLGLSLGACVIPSRPGPRFSPANLRARAPKASCRSRLCAGAAAIDLTPPEGVATWLAGFGFQRARKSVRDPISARCLYLDDGEHRLALVVADLIGLLRPTVQRVRALVGEGVEVAVACTHNHQSPDTMGYWGPALMHLVPVKTGLDRGYQRVLEQRLAQVVLQAIKRAVPVQLAFARAELPKGLVKNLRHPGIYDPAIELLEARRRDGQGVATLAHFGCHAETLGDQNRALSADFPGPLRAQLEAQRGGTALYANGILGGMITPDVPDDADAQARGQFLEHLAEQVATVSLAALAQARPQPIDRIRYLRAEVELASDNPLYHYVERVGLIESRQLGATGHFSTEVGRIDLGPASWALVPGEPTPQVGLRIKNTMLKAGRTHPAVISLANDELGYLLDPSEYDDPLFSYEATVSPGRDAALRLEAVLASLPV
jgi:hypothetical protein